MGGDLPVTLSFSSSLPLSSSMIGMRVLTAVPAVPVVPAVAPLTGPAAPTVPPVPDTAPLAVAAGPDGLAVGTGAAGVRGGAEVASSPSLSLSSTTCTVHTEG